MEQRDEQLKFIRDHAAEIAPVVSDPEMVKKIAEDEENDGIGRFISDQKIENILEESETKVFLIENKEARQDGRRVLLTADNPGAYYAIEPLISALKEDPRCKAIGLLLSGIAAKKFEERFSRDAHQLREKDAPVLYDALKLTEKESFDIVFATKGVKNDPGSMMLLSAKNNFGARKVFFVEDSWGGIEASLLGKARIDVDGIFCNDVLAKEMIEQSLPQFPEEKILATGTGQLSTLETQMAEELRKSGREKLGIGNDTFVLLYLGDQSAGYQKVVPGVDGQINEVTFSKTLLSVIETAHANPEKKIVFVLRLHPRDDPNPIISELVAKTELPKNLTLVTAPFRKYKDINEIAYASDIILSLISTENIKATYRGRRAIFLGFKERGLGGGVLKHLYGFDMIKTLRNTAGIKIADSAEALRTILANEKNFSIPKPVSGAQFKNIVSNILDIAFK